MSDIFSDTSAAEKFLSPDASSPEEKTDLSPSTQATQDAAAPSVNARENDVAVAIAELDKMDKFKLDGQEWTLKDLKAAILRQKDYTQKTQTLAEERKAFLEDKKFSENLAWDLMKVRENPALVQAFIQTYPQRYHSHVEEFLKNTQEKSPQPNVQSQGAQPQVDVQLLSRLHRLEETHRTQEIQQNEKIIETTMNELNAKYPDAANFKEMVLGRAFEAHSQGKQADANFQLTKENWEEIYKQVDQEVGSLLKAKYGSLVKKQTEANAKSRDAGAGGGTVGRAPVKFSKFDDLQKHAEQLLKGGA
jgi:hypothetical protein